MASNPAQIAQPVAIRALVSAINPGAGTPGGTVGFSVAGCESVPLQNGLAICNTTFSTLGTRTIQANYSGDSNFLPGAGTLMLTVGKVVAGLFGGLDPSTPVYGAQVKMAALLLPAQGVAMPTGIATFYDRGTAIGSAALGADGRASIQTTFSTGDHVLTTGYSGDAWYQPSSTDPPLYLTVAKAATNMALSSDPAQIAQPVAIRASVTMVYPAGGPAPVAVDFTSGGKPIAGCGKVPVTIAGAVCTTRFAALGTYPVEARFDGDSNVGPSSATLQITVGKVSIGAYLASSPEAPVYGALVKIGFLALGAQGVANPTGNVVLSEGAAVLRTASLGSDGRASFTLTLPVGSHSITAAYGGDALYKASAAVAATVTVAKAGTTLGLTAMTGGPFTASVNIVAPTIGAPTGSVQFLNAGTVVGTAPVAPDGSNYTAVLPVAGATGSIVAVYSGDINFTGSSSSPVQVSPPQAQVQLTSDRNPAAAGQNITFTAAVYVTPRITGSAPAGSVTLTADGVSLGTSSLNAGIAVFHATLAAGSHTVTARYSGDAGYSPATASLTQSVNLADAILTLTSSVGDSVFGQPVTFTARTEGGSGEIRFSEGAGLLGSGDLSAGTAALTLSGLRAGVHKIIASWAGDATRAAASAELELTVHQVRTTTVVTVSEGFLRAAVTPLPPSAGVPTGSIRFFDPATNTGLGSASLVEGTASLALPAAGSAVSAVYGGDENCLGSASARLDLLTPANAASYETASFAPDEIVSLFGPDLPAGGSIAARVTDSAGVDRPATILFTTAGQAAIVLPPDLAKGRASLMLSSPTRNVTAEIRAAAVAPGLFAADSSGHGAAAAQLVRVHKDGTREPPESIMGSIDSDENGDTLYVILYGTGIRHFASLPRCSLAGRPVEVLYAGAQESYPGLDQVNVRLPAGLVGAGTLGLNLTVDGIESNTVTLVFH